MKHSEIGISIYPDFYGPKELESQVLRASELGYTHIFTSIQLGDSGFDNTKSITDYDFLVLFELCEKHGLILHVDINNRVLKELGGTPTDLSVIKQLKIKVLRLDGGFTNDEVAQMTNNPYDIQIEENTSMLIDTEQRILTIATQGTLSNYVACHNFFPRNDTGLSFDNAIELAQRYASHGLKNGIFIGSLYSPNDLNASGNGVPTIEEHRTTPAHIAYSELRNTGLFDIILFGDSNPRDDELVEVARVAKLDYVEIPVWLDVSLPKAIKTLVTDTLMLSRPDQAESMIRATQTRKRIEIQPYNTILRPSYAITLDNNRSNRYEGECQIMLKDLPSTPVANVIGQVKPTGKRLVEQVKSRSLPFKLKEE